MESYSIEKSYKGILNKTSRKTIVRPACHTPRVTIKIITFIPFDDNIFFNTEPESAYIEYIVLRYALRYLAYTAD